MAEALSNWLPKVIQGVEPFVSAKDIDKGANWSVELAKELEDAEFGIVCMAPDNLLSPWLNYEAGAITKSVNSRVCPVLFEVDKAEVNPPIAQLQMTSIEIDDFLLLMASMNKVCGSPLSPEALKEAVHVWWPLLEKDIKAIAKPRGAKPSAEELAAEPEKPDIDIAEMVSEVLHRVRNMDMRVSRIERSGRPRPVARQPIPAVQDLSSAVTDLMSEANSAGLVCHQASNGSSSIDIQIDGEIPDILPHSLYRAATRVARDQEVRVRVVGTNRVAVFEKGGTTVEQPF